MKWRATDLIDFEFLLRQRSDNNPAAAGDADRQIYQAYIEKHPEPVRRSDLFRYWLARKREEILHTAGDQAVLPGKAAAETIGLARWATGIAGLLLGAGLCGSLLSYTGDNPINILTCLWVMIAPQLILLLLLGLSSIFRAVGPPRSLGGFYPLLTGIFRRAIKKLINSRYNGLSAAKQAQIDAVTGMIGQSRSIYGRILFRPIFFVGQVFGICFNIGIIGVLLFRVTVTDLAFGWQSTLQPAAETIYHVVAAIALPWSWLVPDTVAHPTVSQIEGSQFVYKAGMHNLDSPALAAWWPFLLLAVTFYGLLPRLVIFTGSVFRQQRAIKRLSFAHAACDRLLLAMKTPRVKTGSRPYKRPAGRLSGADESSVLADSTKSGQIPAEKLDAAIALLPEDIAGQCRETDLRERLRLRLGLELKTIIVCRFDPEADSRAIRESLADDGKAADNRLIILQEAWQPPIRETLSWISAIRRQSGTQSGLILGLIGKPGDLSIFTPPADTDRMIWEHAIAKLGDPYIRVEILGE